MIRQALFSMPLSFAIVLVAAIALSGPLPVPDNDSAGEGFRPVPINQGTVAASGGTHPAEKTDPVASADVLAPAPAPPPVAPPSPVAVAEPPVAVVEPPAVASAPPVPVERPPVESPAPAPDPAEAVLVGRPTVVASEPGETIADVAARVYGTIELVEPLIDLNADVAIDPGRPLPEGTLLRLP